MKWFGPSWHAPICDPDEHVPTPVGETCDWCHELVDDGDAGVLMGGFRTYNPNTDEMKPSLFYFHRNCFLRQSLGSFGHLTGRCGCFVGMSNPDRFDDPPEMTAREAADAAVAEFERQNAANLG